MPRISPLQLGVGKVHYLRPLHWVGRDLVTETACGQGGHRLTFHLLRLTEDRDYVTCEACRRTVVFRHPELFEAP